VNPWPQPLQKPHPPSVGEGDPVVFSHGAGGLMWDPFLDALAEGHRVIAPQHLGSGDSQGIEHLYDIFDLVLYYAELFDVLGLPEFSLIGHSFARRASGTRHLDHHPFTAARVAVCRS
jgi:pimeloyl-ACP methyl ester carboxylesterase